MTRKEIAIYGKGGIGKSTISANLSAALSSLNRRVLQIGCDPKHDSTRLLCGGETITTVLDYIRDVSPEERKLGDIVRRGFGGIDCVEAGGPRPGVGCAGRGILSTFDLLEKLNIEKLNHDYVIYDVLGDVVCGGFAVPIRNEYSDVIYIVTSGEYMAIYAANNILRGIKNYDNDRARVGGIILNRRGIEGEEERVNNFIRAVGLPLCADFERSDEFTEAERLGIPLVGLKDSKMGERFLKLASSILAGGSLYSARPLSDEELEEAVLGITTPALPKINTEKSQEVHEEKSEVETVDSNAAKFLSKNMLMREPLHGCAFNGAVNIALQVSDGVTIAHGPDSCSHISLQTITSSGRRVLFERGACMPNHICPPLVSSGMNEGVMVFGGLDDLRSKVSSVRERNPSVIFIATTCPSGIIGEDVESLVDMSLPDQPVVPLITDGNLTGDFLQGIILAYIAIGRALIDRSVAPKEKLVNVVAEKSVAGNTDENFRVIENLLSSLGVGVNCRFLCKTDRDSVSGFLKAPINILAYEDYLGRMMREFLEEEYGAHFLPGAFPVGFEATSRWLREAGEFFSAQEAAEKTIEEKRISYQREIAQLRPLLSGKKLMVVTYNHDIDWLLEPALDLGMEVVKLCILKYSQENVFRTAYEGRFEVELEYDNSKRARDMERLSPDILLTNYFSGERGSATVTDTIPLCPDVGFYSGLYFARRWASMFKLSIEEGWRDDEKLFRKYNA